MNPYHPKYISKKQLDKLCRAFKEALVALDNCHPICLAKHARAIHFVWQLKVRKRLVRQNKQWLGDLSTKKY